MSSELTQKKSLTQIFIELQGTDRKSLFIFSQASEIDNTPLPEGLKVRPSTYGSNRSEM